MSMHRLGERASRSPGFVLLACSIMLPALLGQGCPSAAVSSSSGAFTATPQTSGGSSGGTNTGSGTSGGTTSAATVNVEIDDFVFVPKSVTIQAGQTVRWINRDFTPHAVRSGNPDDEDAGSLFRAGSMGAGKSFQYTFSTPGTYRYHCEYHYNNPGLRDATVIVTAAP